MMDHTTLARNFKALAHPRRAMIFSLLAQHPELGETLATLEGATRLRYSSLVHHLREMERCGLIRRRRRGACVAYRLAAGEFTLALAEAMRLGESARRRVRRAA